MSSCQSLRLASAGCHHSPSKWLFERTGPPRAPRVVADKAMATKGVVTFSLIFYFWRLDTKRFNICLK